MVLIDNSYSGPPRSFAQDVVVLPPPDIRIPRERYGRLGNFRGDRNWMLSAEDERFSFAAAFTRLRSWAMVRKYRRWW